MVGVIDESAFTKKGTHSAGVARQHNGRLGKEDNCQVGVFLVGVTPAGSALLDHRLFLPESWCEATVEAKDRRDAGPHSRRPGVPHQAADRRRVGPRRCGARARSNWTGSSADEEYGRAGHFLDELETLEQRYVLEVPVTTAVWTADPAECIPEYSGRGRKPTCSRPGMPCARWSHGR